jgi:hypothetical protein
MDRSARDTTCRITDKVLEEVTDWLRRRPDRGLPSHVCSSTPSNDRRLQDPAISLVDAGAGRVRLSSWGGLGGGVAWRLGRGRGALPVPGGGDGPLPPRVPEVHPEDTALVEAAARQWFRLVVPEPNAALALPYRAVSDFWLALLYAEGSRSSHRATATNGPASRGTMSFDKGDRVIVTKDLGGWSKI